MNVSGKTLYNKVRGLCSDLSSGVTPGILDKICDEPLVQPFLKWFCENVNYVNVLSNEDVQVKKRLQEMKEWMEGYELDDALEEATKHCPNLLKIISFDDTNINDLFTELEIGEFKVKQLLHIKLEARLDEDVEKEETFLDREYIEADKAYKECSVILKKFDIHYREFFKEVECLLNVYADAAENVGIPMLWTQMPLELFIKKIELYNCYLDVHINWQFENAHKEDQTSDSNYVSLINNSKEKCMDNEKLQELKLCKTNLTNAKIEEILAKVQEKSYVAMLDYVQDIYSLGNLKMPGSSDLRTEISKLTKQRDFLDENVSLSQEFYRVLVQQFSELEITKILKEEAHTRLTRTKNHLEKLKNLRYLAREHGHVHTDLLRMLMEMQFHRLKDVSEFVADACHFLTTEYLLSSTRRESMHQQQTEYSAIITSSPKAHNSFHKIFISMICGNDSMRQLNSALDKYNDLIGENKTKKQFVLKTYLNSKIHKLETLKNEVNLQYMNEIQKGPTYTFKPISYEIETCHSEALDNLQKIQTDLTKIRCQMKERLKADISFERETNILWQRFLVDPDALRETHKEVKQMANKSCFGDAFKNE
ncbi:hypothetical protein WH47_09952 [Habropoda laboriosa]|uniref:HAUS augmin-like complex subunit 3 N-terminal domain-containing protein n=1 Tax=Habropoda laboriosa TaxID=597456 RepID=A0A0L7R3H0_9HYME|nr:hypothetical protein WH47_09952 [Habropoda laboriosa]